MEGHVLTFIIHDNPFVSGKEFQFGDYQVRAWFEEEIGEGNSIEIEFNPEISQRSLGELFATLARMFSSDAYKNIDFRRGLLRGDKSFPGGSECIWKGDGQLRADGTFNHNDFPHK